VLAFRREPGFACVVNVGDAPAELPEPVRGANLLLASGPLGRDGTLPGSTGAWYGTG
jgi:alpha-glucosidase